jgi:hypothetical protein
MDDIVNPSMTMGIFKSANYHRCYCDSIHDHGEYLNPPIIIGDIVNPFMTMGDSVNPSMTMGDLVNPSMTI